jgi:hypothetical protein
MKHPAAKGCTDDGTLAIVPIYVVVRKALLRTANLNDDCDYSVLALHYKVLTMMHNIVSASDCIQ